MPPPKFTIDAIKDPRQLAPLLTRLSADLETAEKRIADLQIQLSNPTLSINTILAVRSALQARGVAPLNVSSLLGILGQSQRGFAVVADSASTLPSPVLYEVGTLGAVLSGTTLTFYLVREGMPRAWVAQTSLAVTVIDNSFTIQDDADATKLIRFEAGSITTGNTRVMTAPDVNQILAGRNVDNAFSVLETFAAGISVTSAGVTVTGGQFDSSAQNTVNAYAGSAQTLTTSTAAMVDLDNEAHDQGAMHSNVTNNSRITIPTAGDGIYLFVGQVAFVSNSTGYRRARILGGGAVVLAGVKIPAVNGDETIIQVATIRSAVATDYVELEAWQNSGGNLDTVAGVGNTFFAAYKLC